MKRMTMLMLSLALTGCAVIAPSPTPTSAPTYTPFPSQTPLPTYTPYPTFTPRPSPRPTTNPNSKYECAVNGPSLPFDNVYNDSAVLTAWVVTQSWAERTSSSTRQRIFDNIDMWLVNLRYYSSYDHQLYATQFIVIHGQSGFATKDGVLWIDPGDADGNPCWLIKRY